MVCHDLPLCCSVFGCRSQLTSGIFGGSNGKTLLLEKDGPTTPKVGRFVEVFFNVT